MYVLELERETGLLRSVRSSGLLRPMEIVSPDMKPSPNKACSPSLKNAIEMIEITLSICMTRIDFRGALSGDDVLFDVGIVEPLLPSAS